ncbi:hypothetical protein L198_04985 [Cryptococcus wingfieldii CBS 7118]|uniref:Uncharacterized protein n=1 Tax=Cryptococcus wingfieldii CBS 7118 TaxID=1295528 RepID=A0A1E3J1U5_9TREE|nr:hypothetical protein L198_04985 [Cryptococcus wingfieldii CBS 7118]ODN94837.1 hypothetical protein L198_04985 [Cryptococcus wingfieldii CBS 7118]
MANLSTDFVRAAEQGADPSPVFVDAARHLTDLHERGYIEDLWELWRSLREMGQYDIPPILFFPFQDPRKDIDITLKIRLRTGGFELMEPRNKGWEEEGSVWKQVNDNHRLVEAAADTSGRREWVYVINEADVPSLQYTKNVRHVRNSQNLETV